MRVVASREPFFNVLFRIQAGWNNAFLCNLMTISWILLIINSKRGKLQTVLNGCGKCVHPFVSCFCEVPAIRSEFVAFMWDFFRVPECILQYVFLESRNHFSNNESATYHTNTTVEQSHASPFSEALFPILIIETGKYGQKLHCMSWKGKYKSLASLRSTSLCPID